jgi:hypothetical protein
MRLGLSIEADAVLPEHRAAQGGQKTLEAEPQGLIVLDRSDPGRE